MQGCIAAGTRGNAVPPLYFRFGNAVPPNKTQAWGTDVPQLYSFNSQVSPAKEYVIISDDVYAFFEN